MTIPLSQVQGDFERHYGRGVDGVWSAPGRVNLIGEHTDYNEGYVLPFAINRRAFAAFALRDDRIVRASTSFSDEVVELELDAVGPDTVDGWAAYALGSVWAFAKVGADLSQVRGFDLYLDSDVPVGAGLSSSAAIVCSVALALNDLWGLGLDRQALVNIGHVTENDVVGAPTGVLDQSASLLSKPDAAIFIDCRTLDNALIPLALDDAELEILVIDTKVHHAHADGGYRARRESCEAGAAALGVPALRDLTLDDLPRAEQTLDDETFRRVRHVVTEDQRVLDTVKLLREQGPAAIGSLLDASHASMRDDFEISVPELDLAVETAVAAGALGARMTGGGFGGSAIALVPVALLETVQEAVLAAFAEQGHRTPDLFVVSAADGAHREV
jgi:galactokinase